MKTVNIYVNGNIAVYVSK